MNNIHWNYEWVWLDVWPQNKCRSVWPIFHGPVILPYILTIWYINTILWDCVSMTDVRPKINVVHCDLYFMVQRFCLISWRLFAAWTSYFGIMSRYDMTFDFKINVGHCDLYFWFSDVALYLKDFDIWTPYFGIMSQYDPTFDLKINVVHCDLYFMVQWFCLISWKTVWYMNTIFWDYESVWHDSWPQNKCRSLWPIFHGPVILLISWKLFRGWTSYFGTMSQFDPTSDLKIFIGHCDLYSWSSDFALYLVWILYFVIMCQCYAAFALKQCKLQWSIFFMVQWFCLIS